MILIVLSYLLALIAIGLALWLGGQPERHGAFVIAAMMGVALVTLLVVPPRFNSVDPVSIVQDTIGLFGFATIGINSRRIWPLWAAAFQLLSVGAHFVRVLHIPVRPVVYAWMKSGPTWAVLALLIIGTLANARWKSSPDNAPSLPD